MGFIEVPSINADLQGSPRDHPMNTFVATLVLAVAFIGIGFAGIAVKILFKKNGEFSGTCASNSPFLNEDGERCSFCGAMPTEQCKNDEGKKPKVNVEEFTPFVN